MSENFYNYQIDTDVNSKGYPTVRIFNVSKRCKFPKCIKAYYFFTKERQQEYIENFKKDIESRNQRKQARQQERKNFKTSLKVGDILDSSWGYEQTNVNFYQVIKVITDKKIVVREISQERMNYQSHGMACDVIPVKNSFLKDEPEITCVVRPGETVKIDARSGYGFRDAYPWDGSPRYCSWYY